MDARGRAGDCLPEVRPPPAVSVAVTDTHALIWYGMGPQRKLGRRARTLFAHAERGQSTIYVPVLVLVEIAEAIRRDAIRCDGGFTRWADGLLSAAGFVAADLTAEIVAEAERLYAIPERADRLIAATAAHLGWPLITRDAAIGRVFGVDTLW